MLHGTTVNRKAPETTGLALQEMLCHGLIRLGLPFLHLDLRLMFFRHGYKKIPGSVPRCLHIFRFLVGTVIAPFSS